MTDKITELKKGITFLQHVPDNKWDRGKFTEIYENEYKESLARLEKFKKDLKAEQEHFISKGTPPETIEEYMFGRTDEHVQLLGIVLEAKKKVEWMEKGKRGLTYEKIRLLESMIFTETNTVHQTETLQLTL
jgi:hypothetical protein